MRTRRLTTGGWFRLLITQLAVICMLARAVMPIAADAHAMTPGVTNLTLIGASLCNTHDGGEQPVPMPAPSCDHCPLCAFSDHDPPVLTVSDTPPMALSITEMPHAASRAFSARPHAPPGWSNPPRAPPSF